MRTGERQLSSVRVIYENAFSADLRSRSPTSLRPGMPTDVRGAGWAGHRRLGCVEV